jgi:hypothetical protein
VTYHGEKLSLKRNPVYPKMKHLGINLTNQVQGLYEENYRIDGKKIKEE